MATRLSTPNRYSRNIRPGERERRHSSPLVFHYSTECLLDRNSLPRASAQLDDLIQNSIQKYDSRVVLPECVTVSEVPEQVTSQKRRDKTLRNIACSATLLVTCALVAIIIIASVVVTKVVAKSESAEELLIAQQTLNSRGVLLSKLKAPTSTQQSVENNVPQESYRIPAKYIAQMRNTGD